MYPTHPRCRTLVTLVIFGALLIAVVPVSAQENLLHTGTANGTKLKNCPSDPGGVSGTCWGLNISSCPIPPTLPYDATVKFKTPEGASLGTIVFISGGGGVSFYDTGYIYGADVINTVVAAGFSVAQIVFDNQTAGWLTGPATDGNGPISLACLPATAMQWISDNAPPGSPFCATGNSGGAAAVAYALAEYGLGSTLSMAEITSGPVFSRLDHGCAPAGQYLACATCGTGMQDESYGGTNAKNFVDPAYTGNTNGNGICSKCVAGSTCDASLLHHDSILSDTFSGALSYPTTDVHVVFGGLDLSGGAVPEGIEWTALIATQSSIVCVPAAGHDLANYQAGATQIENDLIGYCKLQP